MADFEGRLSYIENLHTNGDASFNNPIDGVPGGKEIIRTDDSQQLRAMVLYLQKKLIDHLNTHSDKKGTYSSYIYGSIKEDVSDENSRTD